MIPTEDIAVIETHLQEMIDFILEKGKDCEGNIAAALLIKRAINRLWKTNT